MDLKKSEKSVITKIMYSEVPINTIAASEYIIVVMTDGADYDQAISFIRKVSEIFYNYFNQ